MTPLRLGVLLAVVLAGTAEAYEHLGETVGSDVLSQHWRTLPIALTVDDGPTNVLPEISTAAATWNGVGTAKDPWGAVSQASVDFTRDNMGTAWGNLDGDGKQEVVVDEDGSIMRRLGLAPASVNGMGLGAGVIDHGEAAINDMNLLINGSRTDFDRPSTELHELGHTLGLAHSSAGWPIGKDGALEPQCSEEVATMHPFSIGTTDRRTLEPDDVASLSELYPEPSFRTTTGTIAGTVTRCGSGEPVLGANVRAINVANKAIQLSRLTGFDGKTDGSYTIDGLPPGDSSVVPSTVAAGETRDVTISGGLTHFAGGSVASLGSGVTVNRLTAQSPTSAVANVTVAAGAAIGFRDVRVQTGGELAAESVPGPFLVASGSPPVARLLGASPASAARGSPVDVALSGAGTAFASGVSVASVSGTGVQVLSTTVTSPTAAVARLRIAPDAPLGFRDLKLTTRAEEAALLDGFEILAAGGQAPPPAPPAPAPGGPSGGATCTDRTPPSASLRRVAVTRGRLRLSGRATDAGCAAAVARVEVSISRAAGRRKCRFVDARGRLTRARACTKPVRLEATGTASWSLATKRKLPRGTYAIQARAVDAAGNVQARPAKRTQRVR